MEAGLTNSGQFQAALRAAEAVVEVAGRNYVSAPDTLALAYFMTGNTAKAIETQKRVVSLLPPEESPLRTEFEANLAKYRAAVSEQESAEPTELEAKVLP